MIEKDFMEKHSASAGTKTYESTGHDSAESLIPHLLLHASKRQDYTTMIWAVPFQK